MSNVSESLILLTKNERMSESLIFLSESLICSFLDKKTSDSLENQISEFPALAFLHDMDLLKHTTQFLRLLSSNFYFETIIRFTLSLAFQRRIPNCFIAKNLSRYDKNSTPLPSPSTTTFAHLWLIRRKNQFLSGAAWNNIYWSMLLYCIASLVLSSHFWIGEQNVEKHIEKGIFSKLLLNKKLST